MKHIMVHIIPHFGNPRVYRDQHVTEREAVRFARDRFSNDPKVYGYAVVVMKKSGINVVEQKYKGE